MYQKDYILRMLEMLSDLIALILGLIKKGDITKASERLDRVYYDMLKQDAAFFRNIPKEKLTETLREQHNYTNGHLEVLAELFNVEAELNMAQGNLKECLEYSGKSLLLFKFIDKEYRTYSFERDKKIKDLEERIERLKTNN
jgi:hypothetical protein